MKSFFHRKLGTVTVAVCFALLLFLTARSSTYKSVGTQISGTTETYTHTLTNVPIDLKYDSDHYFISGYSYEAEVYLTSTNRVKLDSEINADTRHLKIVADLSKSTVGKRTVSLKVTDLPSGMTATVSPATISVKIGKKTTKKFAVQADIESSKISKGYEVKSSEVDISEVSVTSDESIIGQIDHVIAQIPEDKILSNDYSGQVNLQAVSADGTILASIISPAKANLTVKVKKLTKTVPITVKMTGTLDDSLSDITYKLSKETATISGSQEDLDQISEVVAEVDVSDVIKDTSKTVNLSATNVTVEPSNVTVQLTTQKK